MHTMTINDTEVLTYGFYVKSRTISEPSPQVQRVSVPGRNGSIDLTEVATGSVRYDDRTIKVTLRTLDEYQDGKASDLANFCHGQRVKIAFEDDPGYYWLGRIELGEMAINKKAGDIDLTCTVDPYKYSITTTADDWLWDPFDFDNDIINEGANLKVDGTLEYTVESYSKLYNPLVTSDAEMTLSVYKDDAESASETWDITEGINALTGFVYGTSSTRFVFTGNGTVTINVTGGRL